MRLSAVLKVRFALGTARDGQWCEVDHRPVDWASRSLTGEFEHVIENVVQDEDSELARRQELKGRHEGQRDGFGPLVAGLRAERHIDRTFEEGVGKGSCQSIVCTVYSV
jgi:hypothetical protein